MSTTLRPLLVVFVVLTAVTGFIYPLAVTGIGHLFYPRQTAGSLVMRDGMVVGSELISQSFEEPRYFWGRLSATTPTPNNAIASGGSNIGPSNPALIDAATARLGALRAADPDNQAAVPGDLVSASGSGLDPHVSPAAALYQVPRVAAARGIDAVRLRKQVLAAVERPQWGVFGEPRVNVLMLNLAMDQSK